MRHAMSTPVRPNPLRSILNILDLRVVLWSDGQDVVGITANLSHTEMRAQYESCFTV